jgi:Cysteine rich repeat
MNSCIRFALAAITFVALGSAFAQTPGRGPGQGPVITQCKDDIAKFCAARQHQQDEVRACLEAKKTEVTAACKTALETTGRGRQAGKR